MVDRMRVDWGLEAVVEHARRSERSADLVDSVILATTIYSGM